MSIEANRATALRFLSLLASGQHEEMFALMADDATWRVAGRPETFPPAGTQSKAQRAAMFHAFLAVFSSLDINVIGTTAEADRVVVEFTARGETRNAKIYENEYLSRFRFRDGKIVSLYEHCDQQAVLALMSGP